MAKGGKRGQLIQKCVTFFNYFIYYKILKYINNLKIYCFYRYYIDIKIFNI